MLLVYMWMELTGQQSCYCLLYLLLWNYALFDCSVSIIEWMHSARYLQSLYNIMKTNLFTNFRNSELATRNISGGTKLWRRGMTAHALCHPIPPPLQKKKENHGIGVPQCEAIEIFCGHWCNWRYTFWSHWPQICPWLVRAFELQEHFSGCFTIQNLFWHFYSTQEVQMLHLSKNLIKWFCKFF